METRHALGQACSGDWDQLPWGGEEVQRAAQPYLSGGDPPLRALSLRRAPACGVGGEVVHPHTALLISTEHIFFCCESRRKSWEMSVELGVCSIVKDSCRIPMGSAIFQQNSLTGTKI